MLPNLPSFSANTEANSPQSTLVGIAAHSPRLRPETASVPWLGNENVIKAKSSSIHVVNVVRSSRELAIVRSTKRHILDLGSAPNLIAGIILKVGRLKKSVNVTSMISICKKPSCTSACSNHARTHRNENRIANNIWRKLTTGNMTVAELRKERKVKLSKSAPG